jgi:DNA-binding NarL/FixJ family response regulator
VSGITQAISDREKQVAAGVLSCMSNAEIAKEINVAERTVKMYVNRLFLRHGIKTGVKRVKLATLLYREENRAT